MFQNGSEESKHHGLTEELQYGGKALPPWAVKPQRSTRLPVSIQKTSQTNSKSKHKYSKK